MTTHTIATRDDWLEARLDLLAADVYADGGFAWRN